MVAVLELMLQVVIIMTLGDDDGDEDSAGWGLWC